MKSTIATICATIALVIAAWAPPPAAAQEREVIENTLKRHGLSTKPLGLAYFLDQGWRAVKYKETLPRDPADKSMLLIQAWTLLTLRYHLVQDDERLKPILSSLALGYARGDFPPGVAELLQRDARQKAPGFQERARKNLTGLLRFNGMTALGVFGDPASERVKRGAREVYLNENDTLLKVYYALTLGLLGDRSVLDLLVAEAGNADRVIAANAARALHILVGRSISLRVNQAIGPRQKAAGEIRKWWETVDKEKITINRELALARKLRALSPPRAPSFRNVRDLLRASAITSDFTDKRGSRTAWKILAGQEDSLLEEIEPIVKNEDEDLDVRGEAIRWYVRIKGARKSKSMLKKLTQDPNLEIAEIAQSYLEKK